MAINPNTDFTVGQVATAGQMNRFPRGVMALATSTTGSQAGVTTAVDITGMSVTFTAIASRNYKVSYHIYAVPTVTNACFTVNLQQGATVKQISIANGGVATVGSTLNGLFVGTFSAGSVTLKLTGALTAGSTGSFTFAPAATLPYTLLVEDIGPA
jgi:hypothetical protein